ncbi:MAG: hypothetical protein IKT19_02540 [Paludibacteraceae bacterium]|nr:hypothetical protein [Paludibacteraceae bacterium]
MHKRLAILTLLICSVLVSQAAVITLTSGKKIVGEVLINNADVVIVRDNEGARFQYPAAEVVSVVEDETSEEEETPQQEEKKSQGGKKVTFLLDWGGGGAFVPHDDNGGFFGGELLIGSRYIGQKSIFLGGGLNVECMFMPNATYVFLPLEVALKVPFLEGKHSPFVGVNLGYGFGVKNCKGGIYTSAEVGWRYVINPRANMYVSLRVQFQQATVTGTTTIDQTTFNDNSGRNFVIFGSQFGISF